MRIIGVMVAISVMMACAGCAGSIQKKGAPDAGFAEMGPTETVQMLKAEKDLLQTGSAFS